jgi:hypothetical protein
MNLKLKIELVPSTSWYNSLRAKISREDWDKIRKKSYSDANYLCEICGANSQLHCHEKWSFDNVKRIQRLEGVEAICVNCHMIKHAGFSMHTEEGKQKFNREELIEHFCKVNNCHRDDFLKHEDVAFTEYTKMSRHFWTIDFGKYNNLIL